LVPDRCDRELTEVRIPRGASYEGFRSHPTRQRGAEPGNLQPPSLFPPVGGVSRLRSRPNRPLRTVEPDPPTLDRSVRRAGPARVQALRSGPLPARTVLERGRPGVNPTAIGAGLPVFANLGAHQQLRLVTAQRPHARRVPTHPSCFRVEDLPGPAELNCRSRGLPTAPVDYWVVRMSAEMSAFRSRQCSGPADRAAPEA
jgi:hypothetical protein